MSSMIEGSRAREIEAHVAWVWLSQVPGVTPTLAGGLLSRLEPELASTPSAFWSYCGLATVAQPHGGRAAQPSRASGELKRVCHALGTSLVRAGGAYARIYRQERARLDETRPAWACERKHLTALRKMEKLFLSHLWLVWREALGLSVTRPHQNDSRAAIGPWEMVGDPRRRWIRDSRPLPPRPIRG